MSLPVFVDEIAWAFLRTYLAANDPHAHHHLPLLDDLERHVAQVSETRRPLPLDAPLLEKLERWRYQFLAEHYGAMGNDEHRAAAELDAIYGLLAHRNTPRPRTAREAVFDDGFAAGQTRALRRALDPGVSLQELAREAQETTARRFFVSQDGRRMRRILLYAPIYLSSYCVNHCLYCGFRFEEDIPRRHLSVDEAVAQAEFLYRRGLRHLLLVAGDFPQKTNVEYYASVIQAIRQRFDVELTVEIAPQSTAGYHRLARAGICGVTLYQETYQEELYGRYHPRGPKSHFDWRFEGHDRAGEAGIRHFGLGVLLGLADPSKDVNCMVRHAAYLQNRFPRSRIAFSLPRIHESPEGFEVGYPVDDETFVRLYCGLRLAFPDAELVLSTRESPELRRRLVDICVTQLSAGSSTVPGGYDETNELPVAGTGEQFPVYDHRPVGEVVDWLHGVGYAVHWQRTG